MVKILNLEEPFFNHIFEADVVDKKVIHKPIEIKDFSKEKKPVLLGHEYTGVAILLGTPGSGKSFAFSKFPDEVELLVMGETIQWANETGPPANLPNLVSLLKNSDSQVSIIDSFTNLRSSNSRLGSKGLDLTTFEIMAELNWYGVAHNRLFFIVFNPIQPSLIDPAYHEAIARASVVIKMKNRLFSATQPYTREVAVRNIPNDKLYTTLFINKKLKNLRKPNEGVIEC